MPQFSFPWTSVAGDRPITAAQAAALHAALAPDGVLVGFAGSTASPNLTVTKGAAIIKGVYFDVGTDPVALSLSPIVGTTAKLVARYDLAARSITLKVIEGALVQSGGTWDLLLATLTYAGGSWGQPVWGYTFSEAAAKQARGSALIPANATAGAVVSTQVTFPVGRFSKAPEFVDCQVTGYNTTIDSQVYTQSITKDGFTAFHYNDSPGNAREFQWRAEGF